MKTTTRAGVLTISILLAWAAVPLQATSILYNNLPNPIPPNPFPPNSPSLGYQSNHTAEFGDLIQLVSGPATLASATAPDVGLGKGFRLSGHCPRSLGL